MDAEEGRRLSHLQHSVDDLRQRLAHVEALRSRLDRVERDMVPRPEFSAHAQQLSIVMQQQQDDRQFLRDQMAKFMAQLTTNSMALAVGLVIVLVQGQCQPLAEGRESDSPTSTMTSPASPTERSRSTTSPSYPPLAP